MRQRYFCLKYVPAFFAVIILLLALSGCTVQLIAPYNSQLVSKLTALQKNINLILLNVDEHLHSKQADYAYYAKTYNDINATMTILIAKSSARPNSQITTKQLTILAKSIQQLIQLHKKGFNTPQEVTIIKNTINQDFVSLYRLQNYKQKLL